MYVPKHFAETDNNELTDIIRSASFATLVTSGGGVPEGTHLPLYLDVDKGPHGALLGHVARANDHWKQFDGETTALTIFTGINAYIGPNWYKSTNTVPTWNYMAIHVYGKPRVVDDPEAVLSILEHLTQTYENDSTGYWTMEMMDQNILQGMLKGIVAFEMPIERIEGKAKMGQNKKPEDTVGAIMGLRAVGAPMQEAVAGEMERRSKVC